jgi:DNA-binding GntR family transcriptional regulator
MNRDTTRLRPTREVAGREVTGPGRAGLRVGFQTKADAAHGELRRRILDGTVKPGSPLNQDRLAVEFGVSTTPLREAIRRLESEGMLRFSAHREVIVSPVQLEGLVDIYEVREVMDALAVKLAASRHTEREATLIKAACASLRRSTKEPLALNRAFHRALYSASHNSTLIDDLDSLWDRSDRHRRLLRTIAMDREVVDEHLAIARAVLEREGDRAASLMARHVQGARTSIQTRAEHGARE